MIPPPEETGLNSLRRYEQVFLAGPDGMILVDRAGVIREANPKASEMFGYTVEEMTGESVELLVPEAARDAHRGHRSGYGDRPETRPMGVGLELAARRSDGSEFPVEISLSPMEVDGEHAVIATIRDISDARRRRAYQSATLRAAEEERRRIARELHDDTAQMLATLLLRLRVASRIDNPESFRVELGELRRSISEIAEGVRRIARGLRPPAIEDAGLNAAVQAHARAQLGALPIDVAFDLEPVDDILNDEEKLVLYRVVQEALSNAVRHGHPRRIDIRIGLRDGLVVAEVDDDGVGFAVNLHRSVGTGLGMVGMTERAALVSGTVEVTSAPGSGTTVRLSIPVGARDPNGGAESANPP